MPDLSTQSNGTGTQLSYNTGGNGAAGFGLGGGKSSGLDGGVGVLELSSRSYARLVRAASGTGDNAVALSFASFVNVPGECANVAELDCMRTS